MLWLSGSINQQRCQYRRDVLHIWGRGSERRILRFCSYANDLGVQQRTEGSECNLLNPSIFMKLNLILIKLEWSTTSPAQHDHALYTLYPRICWSFGSIKAVFWLVYTITMHWRLIDESNWVIIHCFISIAIQMHQHSDFSSLARPFFFLLSFPSSPFFSLKLIHHHHLKTKKGT